MNIVFRVDASIEMGIGHVMRCLTLADALSDERVQSHFVCREHPGNLIDQITRRGYQVHPLPRCQTSHKAVGIETQKSQLAHAHWLGCDWLTDAQQTLHCIDSLNADWLIVDHYALDERWEKLLRPACNKIMVIDDLADRYHDCDLLLDQNLYQDMETRYTNRVSRWCNKLLGPQYVLLRPEFAVARKNLRQRDGIVRRILVFFGGVDPTNETEKALHALLSINKRQFDVDVVVGISNPNKDLLAEACTKRENITFHCQVDNMAELIARADLALAAGGSTMWERCFLKLPSIVCITADNQFETTNAVVAFGAIWNLGHHKYVTARSISDAISTAVSSSSTLLAMAEKCGDLIGESNSAKFLAAHLISADN